MTEIDDFKTLKTVTDHLDFVQFKIRFQKASKSKRMVETRTPETKLTENLSNLNASNSSDFFIKCKKFVKTNGFKFL